MQRREFITALTLTALVWPFAARAQKAIPVIGLLSSASSRDYAHP
jgi:putative ABC transport system substrate-binding protein